MNQLALSLGPVFITGQNCLSFMESSDIERMKSRGMVTPGKPFYLLKSGDNEVCTWSGKGQRPKWVQEWLQRGGKMKEIETVI